MPDRRHNPVEDLKGNILDTTEIGVDMVNNPPHNTTGGIGVTIDILRRKLTPDEYRGFLKGSLVQYILRMGHKEDDLLDSQKASWFAKRLEEFEAGELHPGQALIIPFTEKPK